MVVDIMQRTRRGFTNFWIRNQRRSRKDTRESITFTLVIIFITCLYILSDLLNDTFLGFILSFTISLGFFLFVCWSYGSINPSKLKTKRS
ncbi:MAG: hypothetical protein ACXAC7_00555 [Candidatus Hodarchaeales archaeon]|jgi:hypothetical protein